MSKSISMPVGVLWAACSSASLFGLLPGVPPAAAYDWQIERVDSAAAMSPSLALDASARPHISYCDRTNEDLRYGFKGAAGWYTEIADTGCGDWWASLALDSSDQPHVSYCDCGDHHVRHAHRDSSGWIREMVGGEGCSHTSLALDGEDFPHISYRGSYALCYAYRDISGWHTETVDTARDVGRYTSLALDGAHYPHISYFDMWRGNLMYAYRDTSGWHIETADDQGYLGTYTSIALDDEGIPHISYYDNMNNSLKYAWRDTSGWSYQTVDCEGGLGTSLALDGKDSPHISYYADQNLRCAYRDASGWHVDTVEAATSRGTSLALDQAGRPHIAYHDHPSYDLMYAFALKTGADEGTPAPVIARGVRLLSVIPNPASKDVNVFCSAGNRGEPLTSHGCLRIFDHLGRLVATPSLHAPHVGTYSTRWDLTSSDGRLVAPGVYFLRLEADREPASEVERLVVIR